MTKYPALGFDPAPGDLGETRELLRMFRTNASRIADVKSMLSTNASAEWVGQTATAFRSGLESEFEPRLVDAVSAFDTAVTTIGAWVEKLENFQSRAAALEEQAASILGQLDSTESSLRRHSILSEPTPEQEQRQQELAQTLAIRESQLTSIRSSALALKEETDAAAAASAGQLVNACEVADRWSGSRWDQFKYEAGQAWDYFADNILPILEDIVEFIGPIVSIVAIFVPVLAPLALGLAIASVAIDVLRAVDGQEGALQEALLGALGLGAGAALGRAASLLGKGQVELFVPTINGATRALAGGGTMAGSQAVTIAYHFNPVAVAANTTWAAIKLHDTKGSVDGFFEAFNKPATNLIERGRNAIDGHGPRTNEELADADR